MEKTIIEQFNERMLDLYAERDFYSRGGIIDKAKEALADIIENNDALHGIKSCKKMCPNVKCTVDDCPFVYDDNVTCPL